MNSVIILFLFFVFLGLLLSLLFLVKKKYLIKMHHTLLRSQTTGVLAHYTTTGKLQALYYHIPLEKRIQLL